MRDPCTIPECVSPSSLRRFSWFKWGLLGLMSLLLAILWPRYEWHADQGLVQAVPSTPSVALRTLQVTQLTPAEAGDGVMGSVRMSGSGHPGSTVELLQDGAVFGETIVDEEGKWSFRGLIHLLPGQHRFQARTVGPDRAVISQSNLVSVVIPNVSAPAGPASQVDTPQSTAVERKREDAPGGRKSAQTGKRSEQPVVRMPQVARAEPKASRDETPHAMENKPGTGPIVRQTDVGKRERAEVKQKAVVRRGKGGERTQEVAANREGRAVDRERNPHQLVILGTNRDGSGKRLPGFYGRANPHSRLEILKGQTVLGTIRVRADGTWRCSCKLPPGDHSLVVREVGRPHIASTPKVLTVPNLAPPMILPVVKRTRPTGSVKCRDLQPSGLRQGNLYVVGRCETLSSIAKRLGTNLSALKRYNPQIPDANRIYAGQKLNIPATAACLTEGA